MAYPLGVLLLHPTDEVCGLGERVRRLPALVARHLGIRAIDREGERVSLAHAREPRARGEPGAE